MSDYIYTADNIYLELLNHQDTFYKEYYVINRFKCLLINDEVSDYDVEGIDVRVACMGENYCLYFDDYVIEIETYDKKIMNYVIKSVL